MEPRHVEPGASARRTWRTLRINHGTSAVTTSRGFFLPTTRDSLRRLWTCVAAYPQAGDSGEKQCLTRTAWDSQARFTLFNTGQIGQGAAVPAFHRPTDIRILFKILYILIGLRLDARSPPPYPLR